MSKSVSPRLTDASREVDAVLWEAARERRRSASEAAWNPDGCLTTWRCELLDNPGLSFLSSLVESLNSRAMTLSSVLVVLQWCPTVEGSVAVGAQSHRPRVFCNRRSRDKLGHVVLGFFGKTSFDGDEVPVVVDAMLLSAPDASVPSVVTRKR